MSVATERNGETLSHGNSSGSSSIFTALDAPLMNFKKDIEPIVWQSSDILILENYDLKIPVIAGSVLKYSFSTTLGDISFSTVFQTAGQEPQLIVAPMRVPSDLEAIKGTFKAESDGTFVFLFDNTFSWFTSKTLSYSVLLFQPAFAVADRNRVQQSQRLLQTTVEDSRKAQVRLIAAAQRANALNADVHILADKIKALSIELNSKESTLTSTKAEVDDMQERISYNLSKKSGLCIRCMDNKSLSLMLSFLGKVPESYLVCKYW
eukprot:CAMPEP_0174975056 /NCGR_PEP_ID=MMETSP0004_2-20121128/12218_1 /TAXON_ID=420556 /ORGANISM="Ochromonas sp., Strain CCMP1393" /LENGTH=263 /DNA_ID=CAMNT_0016225839 /DNA_START=72 /DNA_END=860 /DNA_ORIENTATION=-